MLNNTNNKTIENLTNDDLGVVDDVNNDISSVDVTDPDKYKFFTQKEMNTFLKNDYKTIVLTMDNGMPYINYETAKTIFESVVGNNYSLEILSHEYYSEFETYFAHVRITMVRGDKKISKDVIGCETAKKNKNGDIINFHNLPKSAVKDAFKKFLSDYIGIGLSQYMNAKRQYEQKNKGYKNNNSNSNNNQNYTCSDCNASISEKIHNYSVHYHQQKRPLCPNCQKKY